MTYEELVNLRKTHKPGFDGLINQSKLDFDSDCHLDPWAKWHNHNNPDILVIGQDWGNVKYYNKNNGKDNDLNPTCRNLAKLFTSIGIEIGTPSNPGHNVKIHLSNIIPFIRRGKMQGKLDLILNQDDVNNFALSFVKPLIAIVKPEIIITLGLASTRAVLHIFEVPVEKGIRLTDMVAGGPINLTTGIKLLPMFHCGASVINRTRSLEQQKKDWLRVQASQ